jgi:hypothetical protein
MAAYRKGIFTAFSKAGKNGHRIYWCPNGQRLDEGDVVYDGTSSVVAIVPFADGVLTAFNNAGQDGHSIHWSEDGRDLGGGTVVYAGSSPVAAMTVTGS